MNKLKQTATIVKQINNSASDSFLNQLPIIQNSNNMLVDARRFHKQLNIGRDFSTWIKDRIYQYEFQEEIDYSPNLGSGENQQVRKGGSNRIDYYLTLDMAKELAMIENNEMGRKIRRYFIEIEKHYRTEVMQPALYGIFKGLTGVMYMGHRCYPYTGILRNIGYSTKSGAVQERKKRFKGQFFKLFGRNFITAELAEHLNESFIIRLNQRNLQMQLPFEAEGGTHG